MGPLSPADLILNKDGSIYHLHLQPDEIADTVILVGDPGRVEQVSGIFDSVEIKRINREFATHTGVYRNKRITVLSTGIGPDNIDIVLNELDALVNVDLVNRCEKGEKRVLRFIRLGTSGALRPGIPAGAVLCSRIAGGFDGLYHFYRDPVKITVPGLTESFMQHTRWDPKLPEPYFIEGSQTLFSQLSAVADGDGITLSTPGFYAPQVRRIRLEPALDDLIEKLGSFTFNGLEITNFEMESSALYALSSLLGHQAITLCIAVANRISGTFLVDYNPVMKAFIANVLNIISTNG